MDVSKSNTTMDSDVCSIHKEALNISYDLIEKTSDFYYSQSEDIEYESNYPDSTFSSFKLWYSDDNVEEKLIEIRY